jgi:hypothetical protein
VISNESGIYERGLAPAPPLELFLKKLNFKKLEKL